MSTNPQAAPQISPEFLGHPPGLFTLFFAEMWERFSFYGMRALLQVYLIKGFLQAPDERATLIYGAYNALVYATPFIGGILADRLLGARRAVVLGGLLMAAGHLVMMVEKSEALFAALGLLILGNGFFKPNISSIVGSLYAPGSGRRDAGFTIFYIGINLGAALAPLLCGYVGETYGWHYGFGLATAGMLIGIASFVTPKRLTQVLIILGALVTLGGMVKFGIENTLMSYMYVPVGLALILSAAASTIAIERGGVPSKVGLSKNPDRMGTLAIPALQKHIMPYYMGTLVTLAALAYAVAPYSTGGYVVACIALYAVVLPWVSALWAVYAGIALSLPVIAIMVSRPEIAGAVLTVFGLLALASLIREALKSTLVERQRLFTLLILMFFSLLFWAFFEQAGSSITLFTDRNVDRVVSEERFTEDQAGQTLELPVSQAFVGLKRPDGTIVTMQDIDKEIKTFREGFKAETGKEPGAERPNLQWTVLPEHVGQKLPGTEIPTTTFQAINPIFIMLFGLLFSSLWSYLGRRGRDPSSPIKFALGLLQLGLGFAVLWYAAKNPSSRGMTPVLYLVLGYCLHTTGELCISPVGLSLVTKLSPVRIVSTVMGAWFLATAFSHYLAGMIAKLTAVRPLKGNESVYPSPQETVTTYAGVFGPIALSAGVAAVVLLILTPLLNKWAHLDKQEAGD